MLPPSNDRPLCSILIPTYNRADLIEETVQSALKQTIRDIEVVVVDNCSTDGTWTNLQSLAGLDPRVRIFQNKENLGPVLNWCRCLDEAKGVFGKILWSDDLISEKFLEKTIPWLERPDVGFVFTAVQEFDDSTKRIISTRYQIGEEGLHPTTEFIRESLLFGDFPYSPGCALFRLEDLRTAMEVHIPNRLGADFSKLAIGNDLLLFLNTAAKYPKFAFLGAPLSLFRNHANSITVGSKTRQIFYTIAKSHFLSKHESPALIGEYGAMLVVLSLLLSLVAKRRVRVSDLCPPGVRFAPIYASIPKMVLRLLKRKAS